jgi:hypothetical protein
VHGPLRFRPGGCAGKALHAPRIGSDRTGPGRAPGAPARRGGLGASSAVAARMPAVRQRQVGESARTAPALVETGRRPGPRRLSRGVPYPGARRDGDDHQGRRCSDERGAISWLSIALAVDSATASKTWRFAPDTITAPPQGRRCQGSEEAPSRTLARSCRRLPRTTKNREDVSL